MRHVCVKFSVINLEYHSEYIILVDIGFDVKIETGVMRACFITRRKKCVKIDYPLGWYLSCARFNRSRVT